MENFESHDAVLKWMDHLRSPTKESFVRKFERFCEWAGKNPDELIQERREQSRSSDEGERFKHECLVEKYLTEFETMRMRRSLGGRTTYSPGFIKLNACAIKSFFHYNRADLHLIKRLQSFNVKDLDAASNDQISAMHDIADAKERAMLLFQRDSGLRNDTISKLVLGDIEHLDPKRAPAVIKVAPEKAKCRPTGYRSFLSREAIEALNVYLETRRRGEFARGAKPEKLTPSSPVFRETLVGKAKPMTSPAISKTIHRLAVRAGFSNVTAHSLRKSFQTTLESVGVPPNWIKLMMGHKLPGVEGAYSKPSVDELRKEYKEKAEPALSVSGPKTVFTSSEIEAMVDKRVERRVAELVLQPSSGEERVNTFFGVISRLVKEAEVKSGKRMPDVDLVHIVAEAIRKTDSTSS